MSEIAIRQAEGAADLQILRSLMLEYGHYLADNPTGAVNICIENYAQEIENLPGPYAALLLATVDGDPAGCVALKPLSRSGERACEMKRLWVRPSGRGLGLGKRLIQAAMEHASGLGYQAIYLDTVPAAMPEANRLYTSLGFERIERYNDNQVDDLAFFRRALPQN